MNRKTIIISIGIALIAVIAVLCLVGRCSSPEGSVDSSATIVEPEPTLPDVDTIVKDSVVTAKDTVKIVKDKGVRATSVSAPSHDRRHEVKTVKVLPEQLIGEWQMGSLHEEYHADGSGLAWDAEEVERTEAQHFKWSVEDGWVIANYMLSLGGVVPNVTYVTEMDSTHMVRRDNYGNSFFFKKIRK